MILSIIGSYIKIKINNKILTVKGEAHLPGYRSSDFVIYSHSISSWDPSDNNIRIGEEEKQKILFQIEQEMKDRNMTVEIV